MRASPRALLHASSPSQLHASSPSLLKLFALPLTRPIPLKPSPAAFLLHAKRTPTAQLKLKNEDGSKKDLPYLTRATVWAADQWGKLGQADEGSFKRRAYVMGDKFMDRIEFEEWALKAIDPALSPKPWSAFKNGVETAEKGSEEGKVSLVYPESLLAPGPLVDALKAQLAHREPHHRRAMWRCLIGAPLTFPFAIVPVIPNLPLFYVLWRAWSHFRAWKASQYLSSLLSASQITLTPSPELDAIYSSTPTTSSVAGQLLLTLDKVPKIVEAFGLSDEESAELRRAVVQSGQRLKQVTPEGEKVKEKVEETK